MFYIFSEIIYPNSAILLLYYTSWIPVILHFCHCDNYVGKYHTWITLNLVRVQLIDGKVWSYEVIINSRITELPIMCFQSISLMFAKLAKLQFQIWVIFLTYILTALWSFILVLMESLAFTTKLHVIFRIFQHSKQYVDVHFQQPTTWIVCLLSPQLTIKFWQYHAGNYK